MTTILCPVCFEPTPDGLLCRKDTAKLRAALKHLPADFHELSTQLLRQAKSGSNNGGQSASTPLPFGFEASWDRDAVIGTITTWIREIAELHDEDLYTHTPVQCRCKVPYKLTSTSCLGAHIRHDFIPGDTMDSWCEWLIQRIPQIRRHLAVEQVVDELLECARICRNGIDRPADREFVTTCAVCGKGVYGPENAEDDLWVGCRECKRVADRDDDTGEVLGYVPEYQVGASRIGRLEALRQQVLPESDVLVAVEALRKEPLSAKTFRSWVRRWTEGVVGRAAIQPRACQLEGVVRDDEGVVTKYTPWFYVDDALDLASRITRHDRATTAS